MWFFSQPRFFCRWICAEASPEGKKWRKSANSDRFPQLKIRYRLKSSFKKEVILKWTEHVSPYLRHTSYTFRSSCVYFCSRYSLLTCSSYSLRSSSLLVSSCLFPLFCLFFLVSSLFVFFLFFSRSSRLAYLVYSSPPKSPPQIGVERIY